ncbi:MULTISPECIES: FAD-dependent monooxygenase [unclassified Acinetobacter]|uniref:FAD-dependent monooxygenase n=1 Tax=unclassified Acinetobacter TaxID=196816 RepID=UPI0018ED801B|nr:MULTISPECIES: FAD-dependent monooxygenase [unclassified Acinetobacter]MBJ6352991.1 FAD-dependent monooxygenase [Acinetobacter sp. c1]MBM0958610.1 FAD-dependent monooxygenase [Acinetobacter sp. C13]
MKTDICIIGAGPAGLVLALQLAKAGVKLSILESSTSYNRSFRGESMQPDTVSIFDELEILDELTEHGYLETHALEVTEFGKKLLNINYTNAPYKYKYVMDIPQPVLLNALLSRLRKFENCTILRGATCTDLIWDNQRVSGVKYRTKDQAETNSIEAKLVIGADGRYSKIRKLSGLDFVKKNTERDVLWFKIPIPDKQKNNTARIIVDGSKHLILLPTFPHYYRAGVNISKGSYNNLRKKDISAFYNLIESIDMQIGFSAREYISSWQDVHLLDIFTIQVKKWFKDGILLIGDAAHTVTPLLGQGVNLSIQDAMELAPILITASKMQNIENIDFSNFQKNRQKEIDFVLNLQLRQEKLLCANSPVHQLIRRTSYRLINNFTFIQKRISNRIAYKRQIQNNLYL